MTWIKARDLKNWASDVAARSELPRLVRKLVQHTTPSAQIVNFPAGEQVQRPGFDGVVSVNGGHRYVPDGNSVWEMGVNDNCKSKAQSDFASRTSTTDAAKQVDTTFVFVTPREWQGKDDWAAEKKLEPTSNWKEVIALDCNDLEHWLEESRAVDKWLAKVMGKATSGVENLSSYWDSLKVISDPPLVTEVFLNSREAEIAETLRWQKEKADSFFLQCIGWDEGIDFLSALAENQEEGILGDSLLVESKEAWQDLAQEQHPLILVAHPSLRLRSVEVSKAVKNGHHVFLTGPAAILGTASHHSLSRQDYESVNSSLLACGFGDALAMQYAKSCCGSTSILKRLVTLHPETEFPEWSSGEIAGKLSSFTLIGGWRHVKTTQPSVQRESIFPTVPELQDAWLVSELTGLDYEGVEAQVNLQRTALDPLFVKIDDAVFLASREDAWFLLAKHITREQLDRFCDIAVIILSEDDPALELEIEKRWAANVYGKARSLSNVLQKSTVETLALMVSYPVEDGLLADQDFKAATCTIVQKVLPEGLGWKRWASLGMNLITLAEASPEYFLKVLEQDLDSDEPQVTFLFNEGPSSLFGGSHHTELLWALEVLAWSPDYLVRVSLILAKLSEIDPGGSLANRPIASLQEIFLTWLWHTNANLEERMSALKAILRDVPDVAWTLFKNLLPGTMSTISSETQLPRWRPWANGWSRRAVHPLVPSYMQALAELILQAGDRDPSRWSVVVEGLLNCSGDIREKVLNSLESIQSLEQLGDQDLLWDMLKKLYNKHVHFDDASWKYNDETLRRLDQIISKLEPRNPVVKYAWLFDNHVDLPDISSDSNWEQEDDELFRRRTEALKEIVAWDGEQSVINLVKNVENTRVIGWILGKERLLQVSPKLIAEYLDNIDAGTLDFINLYIRSQFSQRSWDFVEELPLSDWSIESVANLYLCLPFIRDTWDKLSETNSDIETIYWEEINSSHLVDTNIEDLDYVLTKLFAHQRPFSAIRILHISSRQGLEVPPEYILKALETASNCELLAAEKPNNARYDLKELLKQLHDSQTVDRGRLARMEWAFLPIMDLELEDYAAATLKEEINSDPSLFIQLLEFVYKSDNEQGNKPFNDSDRSKAKRADQLLRSMNNRPGGPGETTEDLQKLSEWVDISRSLAEESGRLKVCDITIGAILARSVSTSGGKLDVPSELLEFLDRADFDELRSGFTTGVINSRGITSRTHSSGGDQERELANYFRELSANHRVDFPNVSQCYEMIASNYEAAATRHDLDSERMRLGKY